MTMTEQQRRGMRRGNRDSSNHLDEQPTKRQRMHFTPKHSSQLDQLMPQQRIDLIASLSESILEDPSAGLTSSRAEIPSSGGAEKIDDNEPNPTKDPQYYKIQSKMNKLLDLASLSHNGHDSHAARLALLSLLAVFQDILPSYRIRLPGRTMTKKRDDGLTLLSHPSTGTSAKASSVLQNNTKVYGPAKALDCDDVLTSWNSEGSPNGKKESFLIIDFCGGGKHPNRTVKPSELGLQFQAGFSAEEVTVYAAKPREEADETNGGSVSGSQQQQQQQQQQRWLKIEEIEADDDHELQSFPLSLDDPTSALKVVFDETTDFYGRVIVYQIQVWGEELGE